MPGEPKSKEACIGVLFWVILIKLHLVAHLDFGLVFHMHWSCWWMFKAHLQTGIVFPLPCPPLTLTTYMLKSRWGAHRRGVQSLWWQTEAHRHINLLELWEVHVAHHYLAPWSIVWPHRDGCKVPKQSGRNLEPLPLPKSNLPPSQVRKETDSAGGGEHVPGVIMLITDVLFSFREACAVRSVCGVLPGMSPKPKGVGPGVITSTCCEQSQLLLMTYFSWEACPGQVCWLHTQSHRWCSSK